MNQRLLFDFSQVHEAEIFRIPKFLIYSRGFDGNSIIFRRSVPIFAEELREQKFPPNQQNNPASDRKVLVKISEKKMKIQFLRYGRLKCCPNRHRDLISYCFHEIMPTKMWPFEVLPRWSNRHRDLISYCFHVVISAKCVSKKLSFMT